jgi:DNA (cytosine-5)-methyltransferase 1
MTAYYNDADPYVCAWLRNLIAADLIAPGVVDDRPIADVEPADVAGFTQCHWFAGIGGWSYALRLAGWPDDRFVWTGSAPCQPFSKAGKGKEFDDARHVWPSWFRIIGEQRPVVIFGEQVASGGDALVWLDHVSFDLESAGYTVGAVDTSAMGTVCAPHFRRRLYFVAMADNDRARCEHVAPSRLHDQRTPGHDVDRRGEPYQLGDAECAGLEGFARHGDDGNEPGRAHPGALGSIATASALGEFWSNAEWLPCRDGKQRPIEPGTFPLAHGIPARMGRLRAYGNAIVPQHAAAFIRAYASA